ncbi:DDE transposase [Marinicauda pacifica]|uniref:IS1595 family transposase n=1 Tax=Marinicauda pacifica TaxID=1133559 RepID=A0A4S2HBE1_9PROT|nr:IS1595 family transposase [Marinicauda pacifica]TGY93275.1 IS1595 family transposase [Marinicauda pacifica]GGE44319.1 DDE transposase [Marinicauda pacifica]
MTDLTHPIYHDEEKAREHFEAIRWPEGRVCPHCGEVDNSTLLQGKSHRPGLYKCKGCEKPFTATMGTVFESSKLPLNKWLLAVHLMVSSKKGISAAQLQRNLGLGSYRTAWFVAHRIREAMRQGELQPPMGGGGGDVEADETFIGRDPDAPQSRTPFRNMCKVLTLVDRKTGHARSFVINHLNTATLAPILRENIAREARLITDEAGHYRGIGKEFAAHGSVAHARDEYVSREDPTINTQTIEGFFAIFKRGMRGIYQHCSKHHLHRYMAEFDFRYSNRIAKGVDDDERAVRALAGTVGKRLKYQRPHGQAAALSS